MQAPDKRTDEQKLSDTVRLSEKKAREARRDARYLELFTSTELGMQVLADLCARFPHDRPRFTQPYCQLDACVIDGEQNVVRWIEQRLTAAQFTDKTQKN